MSETTSGAMSREPVQSWYREGSDSMPVSPVPAPGPDSAGAGDQTGVEAPAPVAIAASAPLGFDATAPAVRHPHWSGKKTAVAAALAIGLSSLGVVGVAAVVRDDGGTAFDGPPGGFGRHQLPGGQAPNGQFPNGQLGPQQPGQLGQPNQQLPGQLTQPLSPFGDDDDPASDDDSSARATDT